MASGNSFILQNRGEKEKERIIPPTRKERGKEGKKGKLVREGKEKRKKKNPLQINEEKGKRNHFYQGGERIEAQHTRPKGTPIPPVCAKIPHVPPFVHWQKKLQRGLDWKGGTKRRA